MRDARVFCVLATRDNLKCRGLVRANYRKKMQFLHFSQKCFWLPKLLLDPNERQIAINPFALRPF